MRQALKRLIRWIGTLRAAKPTPPFRAGVGLGVESLEDRIAMASLADALAAPASSVSSVSSISAITLTSAPASASMQATASAYSVNDVEINASTFGASVTFGVSGALDDMAAAAPASALISIGQVQTLQNNGASSTAPGGGQSFTATDAGSASPVTPQLQFRDIDFNGAGSAPLTKTPESAPASTPAGPSTGFPAPATTTLLTPIATSAPMTQLLEGQAAPFRINRTPADVNPLQVSFVQTAYGPSGAVAQEGTAAFVPGATHVDIPLVQALQQSAVPREIVTLTIDSCGDYRVAQPTATIFLADAVRGCSDAALFEAFRRGQSVEAFNALFQMHRSAVFRTCNNLLRNLADAEDVSQLVFLMLARQPLRVGMNVAGWLRAVARNACIGLLRSRSRRVKHEKRAAKIEHVFGDDDSNDLRDELEIALSQLKPNLRDAVRLRYLEDYSQHQAAQILGCPRGTVSQRASRGVQALREILDASA